MAWRREYKGYLFDLDGTLIDTAPDLHRALNHGLTAGGYPEVEESLTRDYIGHGGRAMITSALDHHGHSTERIEDILTNFLEYYASHIAVFSRPYPHVESTLKKLRDRGAHLGVVTNKNSQLTQRLLAKLRFDHYFDTVIAGDTAKRPKPAADPVELALLRMQLTPNETLFVGDSNTDVEAARAAGVSVICVMYGYSHGIRADQLGADGTIQSFLDLP